VVAGALVGAVGGSAIGYTGARIGASLIGQSLLRAGAGGLGNSLGQALNIYSNPSTKFNYGSLSGSIVGGLFGGFYAPATWNVWNVALNGSFSSQILQRMIAGIPGAGVASTSNIVGTKLGECK